MLARFNDLPFARLILLLVGLALVLISGLSLAYTVMTDWAGLDGAARREADAALNMLEAVHVQAMLNRDQLADGDPAIATLNGTMEQFSRHGGNVRLWVVMGDGVVAYQQRMAADEIERPRDRFDAATVATGEPSSGVTGSTLRVVRPVVLGVGSAASPRCAGCHTGLMGINPGEVIGAYSAAVDVGPQVAAWRQRAWHHLGLGLIELLSALLLIALLLRHLGLKPLRRLTSVTRRLAAGEYDVSLDLSRRRDELGDMARALEVFRDSLVARERLEHEKERAQSEMRYLASHDSLTGLPNRVRLGEQLEAALAAARRHGSMLAVLCLDLDRFKEVNDSLGHAAGDELLRCIGKRLRALLRETDTAARLGGDEFAILLTGMAGAGDVEALCRRLLAEFAEPVRIGDQDLFVGVSIGAALAPEDGEDGLTLLQHADIALYRAKAEGRHTYRFFAPGMDEAARAQRALRSALGRHELELHYQPLLDLTHGHIVGVEALLRWRHPRLGWVPPTTFIPIAEATGLIMPIGDWLLRTACRQAAAWPDITLSVNLSPVQFRQNDLVGLVRRALEETGFAAARLELEITESVLLEETDAALAQLGALRALGVRIAMDDFGTGYSSLSYLRAFPFDKLKIDQSFVSILEQDSNAQAIVSSVIGLGRSLGIVTTAEGVETPAQLAILLGEGCDQGQGYYFARPQPPEAIMRLLALRQPQATPSAIATEGCRLPIPA